MKIIYVVTSLGVGGAEHQVVDVSDRMAFLGHEVKIIYLVGSALVKPKAVNVEIVGLNARKTLIGLMLAYYRLRILIKRFKPDVVHSHMVHANILTRLVRLTTFMPRLVCTAHSTNEGGRLRMLIYRLTHKLADVNTNVSQEAVASFEAKGAVPHGSMLAVFNGIDTDRFRPSLTQRADIRVKMSLDEKTKIILAIGRLNEAKDYSNLLRAYAVVFQSIKNTRLWIVGDGPLRAALQHEAEDLGINEYVDFLGIQINVEDWINAADVFVLSSAWEGFGLVVAEAMACEKVVVATDAGGVKEVLGDCGDLVPKRNSNALSKACVKALKLPLEDAQELGRRARERVVSHYSLDSAVKRWSEIYGFDSSQLDGRPGK
jgi:glycosyltransferase involved in cell wall biosynthesis